MKPKREKKISTVKQEVEVVEVITSELTNEDSVEEQTNQLAVDEKDEVILSEVKTREPKCTKCRNHAIIVAKKNHKGKCPFEGCSCPKCRNIDDRRVVLRNQVRIRRQLDQREKALITSQSVHNVYQVLKPVSVQRPQPSVTRVSNHSPIHSFNSHPYRYSQISYLNESSIAEPLSTSSVSAPELHELVIDMSYNKYYENDVKAPQEANAYYNNGYYQFEAFEYY